jgi:hypothetical protein
VCSRETLWKCWPVFCILSAGPGTGHSKSNLYLGEISDFSVRNANPNRGLIARECGRGPPGDPDRLF